MPLSITEEAERLLLVVESIALNVEVISQLPEADRPQRELAQLKALLDDSVSEKVLSNTQNRVRIRLRLSSSPRPLLVTGGWRPAVTLGGCLAGPQGQGSTDVAVRTASKFDRLTPPQ